MQCWRLGFDPWVGKIPWRRERLPTPVFWPGEFHYRGACQATVQGLTVRHDWATFTAFKISLRGGASNKECAYHCRRCKIHRFSSWVGKILWRRKWQPTPVFLLGESHGQRSLAGYCPWGRKESDTAEHAHILLYIHTFKRITTSVQGHLLLLRWGSSHLLSAENRKETLAGRD